ncbi:MAG: hypothetical protein BM555_03175 [Crocinitomix sp. MedPE-SWsnd]|nr:MAG: hypothetical protein BM555_03175 [Crocinitomix sp. MedPE-SWsnd]
MAADSYKNIDDLIRDGFDSDNDNFDFGNWNNIEQKLNQAGGLDQQIVTAFNDIPEEFPVGGWVGIQEELDIDTVWSRIQLKLKRKKLIAFIWWNAAGIALLILLSGLLIPNYNADSGIKQSSGQEELHAFANSANQTAHEQELEENDNSDLNESTHVIADGSTANLETYTTNSVVQNHIPNDGIASVQNSNNQFSHSQTSNGEIRIDKTLNPAANLSNGEILTDIERIDSSVISKLDQSFNSDLSPLIKIEKKEEACFIKSKKWVGGVVSSLDNSFLSDATSREGFSKTSLVKNNFVLSFNYGLFGQRYLKNNTFINSEMYVNSRVKRSVQTYLGFLNVTNLVVLDYFKFNASYGKSFRLGEKCSGNYINASIGGFASVLKNEREFVDELEIEVSEPFKKIDYGVQLNLGFHKEFNQFILGSGLHSSIGLNNLFNPEGNQSSFLNRSKTYTTGVYFRFGYKF